jgi:hypothetical protein
MSDYQDYSADPTDPNTAGSGSGSLLAPDWQSRLGGLLGGPRESDLSPIIGKEGFANARSNALLNLGVGMMNAGGWHPYRVSTGQALAQGIQGAQEGYNSTLDNALKTASTAQQIQMSRLTMAGKIQMLRTMQQIQAARLAAAGGQPPAQDPGATGGVSTTPVSMDQPQGVPLGGAVPPMGAGGAAAPQGPAQGAGPAPGGAPMPMPPQGQGTPQAAPQAPPQAPPGTKGSGINPQLIQDMVMSAGAYDPANLRGYVAMGNMMLPEVAIAPNGTVYNKHDYSTIGKDYATLMRGDAERGPDGVVRLKPGIAASRQAVAAATQAGTNEQTLEKGGQDRFGNPLPAMSVADALASRGGQGGAAPPIPTVPGMGGQDTGSAGMPPLPPMIGQGGANPAVVGAATPAPTPGGNGGVYFAPPMGAAEAVNTVSKANAQKYSDLTTQASGSADRVNTLDNMIELANGSTKYGPGSQGRVDNIAAINARLPPQFQILGGGENAVRDTQVMQKYAAFLSSQYQKALGGKGSDLQLTNIMKGTPGPDMLNAAIKEVAPKLKAQELAVQAKANGADEWLAAHNNNPQTLNQFESIWRNNYDPRLFQAQQMPAGARRAFLQAQPDSAALMNMGDYAYKQGWLK